MLSNIRTRRTANIKVLPFGVCDPAQIGHLPNIGTLIAAFYELGGNFRSSISARNWPQGSLA